MKIAVVGTGYVGLVTGAGFSDFGHDVTCVDIDPNRVATLRRGEVPFYEPGLHDLIRRNAGLGRLKFTTVTAEHRLTKQDAWQRAIEALRTVAIPEPDRRAAPT